MGEFHPVEILLPTWLMHPPQKRRPRPAHPKSSGMVVAAIKALKERTGSSLAAIKKYIAANYKVDIVKLAPFIRKALKKGVESKQLVMVKASYKLSKEAKVEKKPKKKKKKAKKPAAKKPKTPKSPQPRSPQPKSPRQRRLPRSKQ